jgi:hypothetical protein
LQIDSTAFYHGRMTINLLIRDVPGEVRDVLAERARARGQSLQAYLYKLVSDDARRAENVRLLAAVRELRGGVDEAGAQGAARILQDLRTNREGQLGGASTPS